MSKRLLQALIRTYQLALSPLLGCRCRFLPTCSHYAMEAVEQHGCVRGGRLALRRLLRCHPWGGEGLDPVPFLSGRSMATTNERRECSLRGAGEPKAPERLLKASA